MSFHADPETPPAGSRDTDQVIHAWFLDLLGTRPDKEISDLLGITSSKLWKLKKGHQRLQAAELVILHQGLNAPLPRLVAIDGAPADNLAAPAGPARSVDDKALFDFAYSRVSDLEAGKPADQRANEFEKLKRVFHILETIRDTPDALELKDIQ
ncbi:hypothetical protein WNZ15_05750 [Roseibium sp. AS2]|uniref:hypothetical protein n=1 Tax=Roseibium sp. AS2 TaxID=3135781 RepID=UPI003173D458